MRTGNQADVFRDFEPSDERPRRLREHSDFRRADRQRDRRFNRRAEGSPVSAFKPDGTSTARTGIFDSLTVVMNFFQPSSSARFKPMPNKPSMMSVGQASRLSPSETKESETGGTPVLRWNSASAATGSVAFSKTILRSFKNSLRGAGVVAVVALAGENQNHVAGAGESAGAVRAIFSPTRRMTSASVWPEAQVARSHSRIWAMVTTGTGMIFTVYDLQWLD